MATAIMKQKGIPEMDDVEEIISKISEESPYKRRPTQKRTWMTVPEMGKLLGLKKTDRYWLVHKNVFESKEIAGKMRINIASFEKWYDSQSRYRTKEDREKDAIVEEATITMPEMARLLGLTRSQVYQILRNPKYSHFFETIVIAEKKRITKENFQKFLEGQDQFHLDPANDYEELALGILHLMKHHIWQKSAEA
jgi:predicted DNA-binding transcriptional regulator AlpA